MVDQAQLTVGCFFAQGAAASNAAAVRRSIASASTSPTILSTNGNPSVVQPHGRVIAGCSVRLKGYVKAVQPRRETGRPATCVGAGTPAANCGMATVGVMSRS